MSGRRAAMTGSFRYKLLVLVLAIIILMGLAMAVQTRIILVNSLSQQLDGRALATAEAVAAQSSELILTGNLYGLHQMLQDMQTSGKDIRYIFIQDTWGRVLSHTFTGGFPVDLLAYNQAAAAKKESQQILKTDEGLIHEAAVPIMGGQLGVVRVGLSEAGLRRALFVAMKQFLIMIGIFSAIFSAAAYLLTAVLLKPIKELVRATRAIARGDLDARVAVSGNDEFSLLAASFNGMVESLRRSRAEVEELSNMRAGLLDQVVTTQEAERQRIARELHDETGGALTAVLLRLKALEDQVQGETVIGRSLGEIRQAVAEAMNGVRRIAMELRPVVFEELGFKGALQKMARDYSDKFALKIHLIIRGLTDDTLPQKVEFAVYRIIQEALNNVIKHARATDVSILLEKREHVLRLIVEDNGRGFDIEAPNAKKGLGLFSMRERASLLGGSLVVESQEGRGTTIYADIPLPG
ncbi:MAG: sensor histidine kinase [Moorella sp. (in: firmicutes)]